MSSLEERHLPLDIRSPSPGWEVRPLGDVAVDIQTGFASGEHNRQGEGILHLRPMNIDPDGRLCLEDTRFVAASQGDLRLRVGDVLFNNTNSPAWVGKTALIDSDTEFAFSNHMTRIRFDEDIDSSFAARQLHFYCTAGYFQNQCKKHVNQASISRTFLAESVPFFVAPLNEQKRIVAKLDALQARHDNAKQALDAIPPLLDKLRQSILRAAFRGDLTREWRARNPNVEPASVLLERIRAERRRRWEEANPKKKYVEPEPVDTSDLPELPEGWCWASLDELAAVKGGLAKGKRRNTADQIRTVPYLRVANVQRGYLDLTEVKDIEATTQEIEELRLAPGDILLNEGGDRDKLGRGWVWAGEIAECIHQNHVFRARLIHHELLPEFISHYANCPDSQSYFLRTGKQTTNLASISMSQLRALPVPLTSKREQAELLGQLKVAIETANALVRATLQLSTGSDLLARAILAKAFRGELVPQDPNDEPASVLLERIRAERAAADGDAGGKKKRGRSKG